jgi:hypothetical protein
LGRSGVRRLLALRVAAREPRSTGRGERGVHRDDAKAGLVNGEAANWVALAGSPYERRFEFPMDAVWFVAARLVDGKASEGTVRHASGVPAIEVRRTDG